MRTGSHVEAQYMQFIAVCYGLRWEVNKGGLEVDLGVKSLSFEEGEPKKKKKKKNTNCEDNVNDVWDVIKGLDWV